MRRKMLCYTAIAVAVLAPLLAAGCGAGTDLSFSTGSGKPVITYGSYKAIAPIYNPAVPEAVIYGDGTLIEKRDPYDLVTGTLSEAQVTDILSELEDKGFFSLEKSYKNKEPLAGGTTESLTVRLESGTHAVSVEGGAEPSRWDDIISTVTDAKAPDMQEYVPLSLTLFANVATEVPPGAEVKPWPGDPADLARAASAATAAAAKLNGESAAVAWKAVQQEFVASGGGDSYWSAGGTVYTYVYATPIIPGVKAGD